jgi:hypothetical protein
VALTRTRPKKDGISECFFCGGCQNWLIKDVFG